MASRSVNKVILIGHLTRDAETKFTPGGVSVTKFAIATNRRWKDQQSGEWKDETNYTDVVMWRGENVANYLLKGKQIYVEGRIQTRSYEDKDGKKVWKTDVISEEVILLGGQGGRGGDMPQDTGEYSSGGEGGGGRGPVSMPRSARPQAAPQPASHPDDFGQGVTEDDVPF
jgi:single-strand DNA-binding protein